MKELRRRTMRVVVRSGESAMGRLREKGEDKSQDFPTLIKRRAGYRMVPGGWYLSHWLSV